MKGVKESRHVTVEGNEATNCQSSSKHLVAAISQDGNGAESDYRHIGRAEQYLDQATMIDCSQFCRGALDECPRLISRLVQELDLDDGG